MFKSRGAAGLPGARAGGCLTEGTIMGLLWTLLIGLIAGALAKLIMPGKDPGGWLVTMGLGVAGSFVGTYLFYVRALVSVWCFFAAVLSLIIYLHLHYRDLGGFPAHGGAHGIRSRST